MFLTKFEDEAIFKTQSHEESGKGSTVIANLIPDIAREIPNFKLVCLNLC